MSDQITYDDKVDLNVETTIADINKVTASNMNEIKSVVNNNAEDVGDITTLTTTDKTSVVNAINELETDKLETSAIVNEASTETDEVYSSDYLNDKLVSVGTEAPTDGRRVWFNKGKNLFDGQLELGMYDETGAKATNNANYRNVAPINVQPSTTYTFSINGTSQKYVIYLYEKDGTFIRVNTLTSGTFTTTAETYLLNFRCFNADFTSDYANLKIQLEQGSNTTPFETFVEKSIKVDNEDFISMSNLVSVGAIQPSDGKRVWFRKSKNLFNKNIATIGGRLDASGGITTQSNGFYSNFISVKANTTYTKNSPGADTYHRVCFYSNANASSFISKSESNTFTTPSNCEYLRFCGYETELDTTMLEESSTATSFEPYIYPSINVDNEEWYSKPKVLWENSAGVTSGSITLNESIANYSYIEVIYSTNTYSSFRGVAKITKNSSTSTVGSLVAEFGNGTTDGIICWTARIVINNANATIERNYCLNITTSGNNAMSDNYISVLKILGYKE